MANANDKCLLTGEFNGFLAFVRGKPLRTSRKVWKTLIKACGRVGVWASDWCVPFEYDGGQRLHMSSIYLHI